MKKPGTTESTIKPPSLKQKGILTPPANTTTPDVIGHEAGERAD